MSHSYTGRSHGYTGRSHGYTDIPVHLARGGIIIHCIHHGHNRTREQMVLCNNHNSATYNKACNLSMAVPYISLNHLSTTVRPLGLMAWPFT